MKHRKRSELRNLPAVIRQKPEVSFFGSISNMTGGFDLFELGSVRRVGRKLKRDGFVAKYCQDISSMFGMSSGQQELLSVMMQNKKFFEPFKWDETIKTQLSTTTGFSVITLENLFTSFVSIKKIIRKIKRGHYIFNTDFIFSPAEVANADFLGINVTYVFDQPADEAVIQKDKKKVTLEDINSLIEIFNQQQHRDKQIKSMFGDEGK